MDNNRRNIIVIKIGNSGSVLLIVMMIITVVLSIALSRNEKLLTYYNELTSLQDTQQGYIYCISALKGITILLERDTNRYISDKDTFAMAQVIPTEHGNISITVIPLDSKISILGLLSNNKDIAERTKGAIVNLIPDINDIYLIDLAKKEEFFSLEALQYSGIKNEKRKEIGFLTVENTGGRININFVEKKVLKAYLPEIESAADEIINYRKEKPFKDISQIRNVPGITDSGYLAIQPYITVESSIFYVYVEALVKDSKTSISAIIKKDKSGKVEIIKYFEKPNELYMYNAKAEKSIIK
ncbi:MAG: general secretion pathway protein GspK [Nitrospirae bacterium]|nr:general secretion pathway protein GspK [Nitrospirota bacterium]MBF0540945.1 general secretion pathway protein GspK [Nitrospirota bacterium]